MYQAHGTFYSKEHSISFGDLISRTSGGKSYVDFDTKANTWDDWHLIPSSRPVVVHPNPITKYIEIPGSDDVFDLSAYLSGRINYGQRQGSFSFYVDNDHENYETIRSKMVTFLHGKKMKMRLMDDPGYYYEGRFTVGNWEPGPNYSAITISYQVNAYKLTINSLGSTYALWDPFNFETDYDYSVVMDLIEVTGTTKTFYIYASDYAFSPEVRCITGSVTATFGGVTQTVTPSASKLLGKSQSGRNTLTISGTGSCQIYWRGGSL